MLTVVAAPLAVLTLGLCICFCWFTRSTRRRERHRRRANAVAVNSVADATSNNAGGIKGNKGSGGGGGNHGGGSCCDCCCISSSDTVEGNNGINHKRKEDLVKHSSCHSFAPSKGGSPPDGEDHGNFIQNQNAPISRGPLFFKSDLE